MTSPAPAPAPDPGVERLAQVIRLLLVSALAVGLLVLDAIELPHIG